MRSNRNGMKKRKRKTKIKRVAPETAEKPLVGWKVWRKPVACSNSGNARKKPGELRAGKNGGKTCSKWKERENLQQVWKERKYLKKVECAGKRLAGYTRVNSNITTV